MCFAYDELLTYPDEPDACADAWRRVLGFLDA
jgi:hypothetical protein